MNFPSQIFFNDVNYDCRGNILKKNSLWLLTFYMAVATYFYYEKVRRTMRTAIVSNLLKQPNCKNIFPEGYGYQFQNSTNSKSLRNPHSLEDTFKFK